MKQNQRR